ncbi:tetraether lipid synthase Tes [Methanococcoides sp.]|uniref:tetraether lipid synthase Tes n=1 Tax=Methanococcoides sp. TaxID=1966350 RepID=UPI00272DF198|nr:radical SAM protein [Methanococcoides sp.]
MAGETLIDELFKPKGMAEERDICTFKKDQKASFPTLSCNEQKVSHIKHTRSICPECMKEIDAEVFVEDGKVFIEKSCSEHGTFKDIYWSDAELYEKFDQYHELGIGTSNPMTQDMSPLLGCGLCPNHKTGTILANIDITNRCNLNCPVCFANAKTSGYIYEPTIEQIRNMLLLLKNERPVPCYAVQFSGGEPTVRNNLPEIIAMARDLGFVQIQIATNGVRLAKSIEFARKLREAGLHTVYLSFDGIGEEPYQIMRGFDAFPMKQNAIKNCRQAGLTSVTLVPTLAKGVNDHQVGDIIKFASERLDVVKGINFQPVAFTGRIDQAERENKRITIPDLMILVEEQTDGQICRDDWYPIPSVVPISRFVSAIRNKSVPEFTIHPHCGTATYAFKEGNQLIPITRFVDVEGLFEFFDEVTPQIKDTRSRIRKVGLISKALSRIPSFIDQKNAPKSIDITKLMIDFFKKGTSESMKSFHRNSLFLGAMHFQDPYNLDIERVQRCGIHYATPDGRIIPFCSYNTMHRQDVEERFSKPYTEKYRCNA